MSIEITAEQGRVLALYNRTFNKRSDSVSYFMGNRRNFSSRFKSLEGFTVDEFARLIYEPGSYEVVGEYEVGDWVTYDNGIQFGEVTSLITSVDDTFVDFSEGRCMQINEVRHATLEEIKQEQEREVWMKMNRQPGEIKKGDIGVNRNGLPYYYKGSIEIAYKEGNLIALYPVESRISLIAGESDE